MTDNQRYRIVNREVIRLGKEDLLDELFREWVYPDLRAVAPELMATAHTFRPVGGGRSNVLYFTAEVGPQEVIDYGSFVWDALRQARSEAEVQERFDVFHECVESIQRLSLVEVMTDRNPSLKRP